MDTQKVDMFLINNSKFFESHIIGQIREDLLSIDDSQWPIIQTLQFKDPTTSLIISLIVGGLGIDRFIIGDIGLGVAKLLTCGGLGAWSIIDCFMIMPATRKKNLEKLHQALMI